MKQKTPQSESIEPELVLFVKPVKKRHKPKTLAKKTAQQLVPPTDNAFSRYIRLRDSTKQPSGEWVGNCITCNRPLTVKYPDGKWNAAAQNGHLIGRGTFSLRYDDENCNLQCAHCNAWLDKDEMIERYRKAVDDKYGNGTYERLKSRSKLPEAYKRPTKQELMQIIHDSNEQVNFLENNN